MSAILEKIRKHKAAIIILGAVILGGGYYWYKYVNVAPVATRYVLAKAEKGTLIVSVSGTGQVSSTSQVDIKPKVAGDIISIGIKNGDEIKTGELLFQLDDKEAQKSVRDAEVNLTSAKLALDKLKKPADALSVLQAQNALTQTKDSLTKLKLTQEIDYQKALDSKQGAQDDLAKAYDDGFNNVSNAFLDLPTAMGGLQDILFTSTINQFQSQWNIDYYNDAVKGYNIKVSIFRDDAYNTYQSARIAYDKNFSDYKSANTSSAVVTIESLITETYNTTKSIAEAVKSANNLIQFYEDTLKENNRTPVSLANTHLATLNTYTGKTNTHLSTLLSSKQVIQTDKDAIFNAGQSINQMDQDYPLDITAQEQAIKEKEGSLASLIAGADPLDIQSQELTIKQRENSLLDAKNNLADYYVRAPFDGVVTKITNKKGDSVSSGVAVATLLTKQKIATITLNEVDVVKARSEQKATLAFDAIDGLSITGKVVEIDTLGTVTQGVVTYNVKIVFDTEDDRVKSGMSVSAAVIIDAKADVILVPNSAVKQQNGQSYVEIAEGNISISAGLSGVVLASAPRSQAVETGLSNDTMTEIISGLKEGDNVITRTITAAQATTVQSSAGGLRIPGMTGGR